MTSTNSTFYDALNAQLDYINSAITLSNTNTNDINSANVINVNGKLNDAILDLSNVKTEQANVLTQQENVNRILDRENARLDYKKNSIDTVISGQKRVADLNRSYSEKYKAYNRILFYVFIFILIFVIIIILSFYIPEGVTTILYIIIISIFIIYLFWAYYDISRRDNLNFDKLSSSSGLLLTNGQAATSSKRYNSFTNDATTFALNAIDSLGNCIGKDCCSDGTHFDISSGMCLLGDASDNSISSFTTIEQAYARREISLNTDNVNPLPISDKSVLSFSAAVTRAAVAAR